MDSLPKLFENNREWCRRILEQDPGFFESLSLQQSPQYLWIGCSDSRVPANQVVGLPPGEIFVHRNVANVIVHADLNCLSVMQYAVDVLRVRHVIVCGHYGCGGVLAALRNQKVGLCDNWLRHVQDVRNKFQARLDAAGDEAAQFRLLCELNVLEQVVNACQTTIVQDAWARGQPLHVHGWIYGIEDGLLRDLGLCVSSPSEVGAHTRYSTTISYVSPDADAAAAGGM
ncbi:MAG TPA: carbonate dehydratase [Planctomycetota bacterium]|nr:carbonate dehydratase [Planctomycetota bacterium]